jgi:hypothetical protein
MRMELTLNVAIFISHLELGLGLRRQKPDIPA